MDFQSWIEGIDGLASLYSFDIAGDGFFSEIRGSSCRCLCDNGPGL